MNTVEKLEQSSIVKEKGTQYFKVSRGVQIFFQEKLMLFFMFSNALIPYASGRKIQAGVSAIQKDCVMAGT